LEENNRVFDQILTALSNDKVKILDLQGGGGGGGGGVAECAEEEGASEDDEE
jgi:hypothetical protein